MSSIRRAIGIATLLIVGFSIVPVSLSPTGGLEVNGLCASGDCERNSGSFCWIDGQVLYGWKNVVG